MNSFDVGPVPEEDEQDWWDRMEEEHGMYEIGPRETGTATWRYRLEIVRYRRRLSNLKF